MTPSHSSKAINPGEPRNAFLADLLAGLSNAQKSSPCRWLYDTRGSALFEEITELAEYYPTRTETAILKHSATAIAAHAGPNATLVEYGAGASVKTRILIEAMAPLNGYVPIDISADFMAAAAQSLREAYPGLKVTPVEGDFAADLCLPRHVGTGEGRTLGFFPGSTIGNLTDLEIHHFLKQARRTLGSDSLFVLGYDLIKDEEVLIAAYDDAQGVTADFNLNLLARANRELGADFDLSGFAHEARWSEARSRVEMHLVSLRAQTVSVDGRSFEFEAGETIHTENSRKFSRADLLAACQKAGWTEVETFTDPKGWFGVSVLRA
jgi:dimethylhistidine N-methyltransferase